MVCSFLKGPYLLKPYCSCSWNLEGTYLNYSIIKRNNSLVFSTFMMLWNHQLYSKIFQYSQTSLAVSLYFPTNLHSVFMDLSRYWFWIFHINEIIQYVTLRVWLLHLMFLRLIHVVERFKTYFLRLNIFRCTCHSLFT